MIILLLLILFFIYSNIENKYKLWGFMIAICLTLIIHEIYMSIGLERVENFNNYLSEETNLSNKQGTVYSQLGYNLILPEFKLDTDELQTYNVFKNIQKIISLVPIRGSINGSTNGSINGSTNGSTTELVLYNNLMNTQSGLVHIFDENLEYSKSSIIDDQREYKERYFMSAESIDNKVMYAGGTGLREQDLIIDTISIYDKYWDVYSQTELDKPRYCMSSYSNEEMVIFAFGINEDRTISKTIDIYEYNNGINNPVEKKSWKVIKCPYLGRLYTKIEYYNKLLMFVGGYDGKEFTNTIITYDMENDKWNKVTIPKDILLSTMEIALLKDSRENISDKLFILSSPYKQSKYLHQHLVYTILDKAYDVKHENDDVVFIEDTRVIEAFKEDDSISDDNTINYNYLGDYIPSLYEKIANGDTEDEYTISMWLYINDTNKGQTRLVMGDYNLCTGESGTVDANEYNGLILHKDKLMPCFKLQKKILIKNNDELPTVVYNKWFHVVFSVQKNFKTEVIDELNNTVNIVESTENGSGCVFTKKIENDIEDLQNNNSTTLAPQEINNDIDINHKVNTYINGVKVESIMNFELKYDIDKNGLVVSGFDIFDDERKYAQKTRMSNFKIFNASINYGTIIDIYRNEYSMYLENVVPQLYYYDFTNKEFKDSDLSLQGFNGIMESFRNEQLVVSITKTDSDTSYHTYNNYTNEFKPVSNMNTEGVNMNTEGVNICAIEMEDGIVFGIIDNNIVKLHKVSLEAIPDDDIIDCDIGNVINNKTKQCGPCPEDTFSKIKNSKKCTKCPYGMSTHGQLGQSQCSITDTFKKKVIDKPLDTNFDTIIESQNEIYEIVKEKIDINNENIKAIDNNFTLLTKKM